MEILERPSPSTLLLTLVLLLLLAPLLLARELGGSSYEQRVRSPLMLPASDDDGPVVRPELDALPGVSRPGGRAPPAPKPSSGSQPQHETTSPSDGLGSPSGVSGGRQELPPPSPEGNAPPHYRRSDPAAGVLDALRVFRDALVRYAVGA